MFQDRNPRSNPDTGPDENGDFVIQYIFCRRTKGTIDAQHRHVTSVIQGILDSHSDSGCTQDLAETFCKIADLTDMD